MGSNPDDEENSSTLERMKGAGEKGYASCLGMTDSFLKSNYGKIKPGHCSIFVS